MYTYSANGYFAEEGISFTNWAFDVPSGNLDLQLVGPADYYACNLQCFSYSDFADMDVVGFTSIPTPEPSPLLLLSAGLLGLLPAVRRLART